MTPNTGFLQLRRGLLQHCAEGRMPPGELAAYILLLLSADASTGVVWSSAAALALNFGFSERRSRSLLEKLEAGKYVRRFPLPGRHQNYPILIDKFLVTCGARRGQKLNAAKSASWRELVFDFCEQTGEQTGEQTAPYQDQESESESEGKRYKQSSAPARPWTGVDDDVLSRLRQELQKTQTTPVDDKTLAFAVERITARASKPPSSFRFFLKAIPNFLAAYEREAAEWLAEQAAPLLNRNGGQALPDGDLRELLKCQIARRGLPYDADLISLAVDIALHRRQKTREKRA